MRDICRFFTTFTPGLRRFSASMGLLLLGICSVQAFAQGMGSSSDPLEMFRSMSRQQQQQILQRLGIGGLGGLGGLGGGNGLGLGTERGLNGLNEEERQRRPTEEEQSRIPLFKPDDYLIIEVDVRPLAPRPTDVAALYQELTAGTGTGPGLAPNPDKARRSRCPPCSSNSFSSCCSSSNFSSSRLRRRPLQLSRRRSRSGSAGWWT
jgi:hypothetical protein